MSRMTREQAIGTLTAGLAADLDACQAILALLGRQFEAALRHRSAELSELAEQLAPLLEAMEQRRVQRVTLVRALCGKSADMATFIATVAAPQREAMNADWQALGQLVLECKRLNVRNSALLTEQFSIMQRVLHGEETLYEAR
ncbi:MULTISPECIES: flagellar export chaperone FlgN [Massilia]|uniref:Flagellar protein FlgN n=1 Tax=Massilia rubra TaxID=2607910 RepID=A0ABX0M2G3_9BURK|nr:MULTISPECIES: flagellar export chaperone FlgN [Massilia]NHZ38407.1 flagellar protein FlgN [Massilia rubra]NHZ98764.1 flagellar protein FlgN [Massilia sp. CCM 8734]